jgi:hypothetical protein|tara:strand:+ start:72 stop:746 length:675 start_codon:yes stop_codon:yes gene_type:complete
MNLMDFLLFPFTGFGGSSKVWLALGSLFWLILSVFSFSVVAGQAEAYTFESTTGTMEESRFEPRPVAYILYGEENNCVFDLHITYSYTVDGVVYNGQTYSLWEGWLSRESPNSHWSCGNSAPPEEIANFVESNPEGGEVTVYYDSSDPQRSVVIRGFEGGIPFLVTIVNTFLLVALIYKLSMSFYSRPGRDEDSLDDVEENGPAKPIEAPMQEKSEEREKWWES